ncbi:hypothetical protein CC78DRAFT_619747 [Lojkania enalia]|uniref:Uncharacterized protein n=1 Tax=Lojkania enalia TaxID=147567 RepID=A0A9P4K4C2_9PLEO|nr:hypothetical protein CC78DRAFT_619747 [Didymosphaeria enalia]
MSSANCTVGICPSDCSDSGLSTTGNIVGILTFAYALFAGLMYYYYVVNDASEEMARLAEDLEDAYTEGTILSQGVKDYITESNNPPLKKHYDDLEEILAKVDKKLNDLASPSSASPSRPTATPNPVRPDPNSSQRDELVSDYVRRQYLPTVRIRYLAKRRHLRDLLRNLTREIKIMKYLARDHKLGIVAYTDETAFRRWTVDKLGGP